MRASIVLLGIFFFLFFLFFLFIFRRDIFGFKEGLALLTVDTPSIEAEVKKLPTITPYRSALEHRGIIQANKYKEMPLNQWCIKGAFNAPRTGNYVGAEGVEYALDKGCRWLDIEVYLLEVPNDDGSPIYNLYCGGVDSATEYAPTTYNQDPVPLSSVIQAAIAHGFKECIDPLFLSFRFQMRRTDYGKASHQIQELIQSCRAQFPDQVWNGPVDPNQPIQAFQKKILFVMDSSVTDYSSVRDVVNISLPGDGWAKTYEGRIPALLDSAADIVEKKSMMVVQPDVTQSGKNIPGLSVITKLGFQIPLMKYYVEDIEQIRLDEAFDLHRTGLVPMEFMKSVRADA